MKYNPRINEAYKLFHDGILVLSRAEQHGIRIDMEYVERKKRQLTRRIEKLENQFKQTKFFLHWQHSMKKVNINSNAQLAHFLYNIKKLEPAYVTESGQGATDEEALRQLNIPELNDLLEIRKLKKIRDTYLEAFVREQVNGFIHPFFNLHLVKTYRSSSDSPNFQNIPKRDEESMQICRRALKPRLGHQLMEVDFSNLEVRVGACYHKDSRMIEYIKNPESDMHADMAKQIFMLNDFNKSNPIHQRLRQAAKNGFVFPQFYGDYYGNCAVNMACVWGGLPQGRWKIGQGIALDPAFHLADHLIAKGINSIDKFTDHVKKIEKDFWENRFLEYSIWKERWWRTYQKYGYIDLLTGFRCGGLMSKNEVINTPIQGTAFHCLLWCLIEVDRVIRERKWDTRLIGQIHDSMLFDVNPAEIDDLKQVIRQITCRDLPKAWSWIIVPLDIDIEVSPVDGSWADKE